VKKKWWGGKNVERVDVQIKEYAEPIMIRGPWEIGALVADNQLELINSRIHTYFLQVIDTQSRITDRQLSSSKSAPPI
jgi:hypothetical protein